MEAVTTGDIRETGAGFIDVYVGLEQVKRSIEAMQAKVLESGHRYITLTGRSEFSEREFRAELATAVRIPENTAGTLIATADTLVNELPLTLDALTAGTISYRHATKLIDHALSLPQDARAGFEHAILPAAETLTVAKFDTTARKLRERTHPNSITERRASAFQNRAVTVDRGRDGMSWITAHLPAEQIEAIDNRLDDIATALHPDDDRTLPQRRADAFADLLINGDPANSKHAGIRAEVMISMPMMSLLGLSNEPAELEGYGPIPADTARELCATAPSFMRLLTHPVTGTVLTLDRTKYPPPAGLRRWLRFRDGTCRFPGCNRKARKTDIDHTLDWFHGGTTDNDNLACLCEHHHRLKHNTTWHVEQLGEGILAWTSPDGKNYITRPELELTG